MAQIFFLHEKLHKISKEKDLKCRNKFYLIPTHLFIYTELHIVQLTNILCL